MFCNWTVNLKKLNIAVLDFEICTFKVAILTKPLQWNRQLMTGRALNVSRSFHAIIMQHLTMKCNLKFIIVIQKYQESQIRQLEDASMAKYQK